MVYLNGFYGNLERWSGDSAVDSEVENCKRNINRLKGHKINRNGKI